MTTGATGQLGLALPVQGELSGTWGDTVNNGITQYTNIAIAATLTLTGDGAVTLANTTGDASASNITSTLAGAGTVTAQFSAVRVSGTTTTKVVTGPSYSKTYLVDNASSFAVTFKASAQTGVSISPSEKVYVYYNGTDYVKVGGGGITYGAVKTANYTAVANDGVLTNTTGGAFTVTLPATPATGTQVFIADSAGTWGTNNLTIGRNGSTIEGSATDLVCDINSVSIQCVYNGTTWDIFAQIGANDTAVVTLNGTQTLTNKTMSGASNTFTNLSLTTAVAGTLPTTNGGTGLTSFTSGGVVYASSTSALATGSALTFDGTTLENTGKFLLRTSSSPSLAGQYGYNATGGTYIWAKAGTAENFTLYNNTGYNAYTIDASGNHIWAIGSGSEVGRFTSTGLGIGTSSPSTKLSITNSNATYSLSQNIFNASAGNLWIGQAPSATYFSVDNFAMAFCTNSDGGVAGTSVPTNERMRISSAGNVGIGTSSPQAANKVQVAVTAGDPATGSPATGSFLQINGGTTTEGHGPALSLGNFSGAKETAWRVTAVTTSGNNGDLALNAYTGGSTYPERARFTNAGGFSVQTCVAVGGATPSSSGAGITFLATQSASSNANTLDDYEEGTWTPIDGSAAILTFTANTGFYTKIGNLVTAQGVFTYPITATGNAARVGGLPFSQTNVTTAGGFVTSSGGANTLMIQSPYAGAVQFFKVGDVTEVNSALSGQTVAITLIYRTT